MIYRCPKCKESYSLWQFVDIEMEGAWQNVDEHLSLTGTVETEFADVCFVGVTGRFGCAKCDWRGLKDDLEQVGIDGNPLPVIHDGQLSIAS